MVKSLKFKQEIPMCVCGHDIFYHNMNIISDKSLSTIQAEKIYSPEDIAVGSCNKNDGYHYICKCQRYNSTDMWMNQLWEEFKQYEPQ